MSIRRLRAFKIASTHVDEAMEKAESSAALVGMWVMCADTEKQCEGFSVTATVQPGLPIPENHENTCPCKMYMDAHCTVIHNGQEAGRHKCLQIDEWIHKIQNSLVMVHTNNTTSDETVGLWKHEESQTGTTSHIATLIWIFWRSKSTETETRWVAVCGYREFWDRMMMRRS